ncbi:MAG: ROK family transcriptional regulator [Schumannella sp.]|nr:ROK family transcriptional regulator [Microbacteriaceae bacterium]
MSTTAPGTPSWLRERNDRTALEVLFEHGPLTRNRLAELTGMSKPTAAQMVARLEQAGLIAPVGEVSGGRGPNAVSYGVRAEVARGVAIDIRERIIAAQVVDALDTDHPVVEFSTADAARTPEGDVRSAIDAACDAAGVDPATVTNVIVGVQAAISGDGDHLSFTDTLPGWPELGARHRVADALGIEVELDNDVNLAAVAERVAGAGGGAESFALLWMSDGLGVAVDLGGIVHRGASGASGEIGYLPVPRGSDIDAEDLTDLVGRGAFARIPDLEDFAGRVALVAAPVIAVLDPELIVLGGPTGIAGGERLAELVAQRLDRVEVRPTGIESQPVLGGARRMLVHRIRERLAAAISPIPSP